MKNKNLLCGGVSERNKNQLTTMCFANKGMVMSNSTLRHTYEAAKKG